jgi:hypothetical protein
MRLLFVVGTLFYSAASLACIDFPDPIEFSETSFAKTNKIEAHASPPNGAYVAVDNDEFYIHPGSGNLCIKSDGGKVSCFSQDDLKSQELFLRDDKTKNRTGLIEFDSKNKSVFIFSLDADGKLNKDLPYLKFNFDRFEPKSLEEVKEVKVALKIHAMKKVADKMTSVGYYEKIQELIYDVGQQKFTDIGGVRVRSIDLEVEKPKVKEVKSAFDLSGKRFFSDLCDSGNDFMTYKASGAAGTGAGAAAGGSAGADR